MENWYYFYLRAVGGRQGSPAKESIRITRAHSQRAKSNGEDNYQATRNKLRGYPRVHPSD